MLKFCAVFAASGVAGTTIKGTIPLVTVNDAENGWSPYTYMAIDGGASVPMLVDTGSSAIAVCAGTNIGSAAATGKYGCGAYGDGTYGWVGSYFKGTATFGKGTEVVKDPTAIQFNLIQKENCEICTKNLSGIIGLDYGEDDYYNSAQPMPSSSHNGCGSSAGVIPGQFDKTLVVAGDSYTYAFIGPNRKNTGDPVIAFGNTAKNLLSTETNAGTALLSKQFTYWYAFSQALTFQFHGYSSSTFCATSTCSFTQHGTNADNVAISDSGTQQLVLPRGLFSKNFTDDDAEILKLPDALSLSIKVGTADITIPGIKQLMYDYDAVVDDVPVLGFPVHWVYDVLFDIMTDSTSAGKITFYERPGFNKFEETKIDPSLRVHGKHPRRIPGSRRIINGKEDRSKQASN
jgi:hypothetical protein